MSPKLAFESRLLLLSFLALSSVAPRQARAETCESSLPLKGSLRIESCNAVGNDCVPGYKALYEYTQKILDVPDVYTFATHSSPWRFYDREFRILRIEEIAELIRPGLKGQKRVDLIASWTSVSPTKNGKSLAEQLSEALGGFPVTGLDRFLWLSADGSIRTTQQAWSMRVGSGPYNVKAGTPVMASFVVGWPAMIASPPAGEPDPRFFLAAGVGEDVFLLCPHRALASFEQAARLSHPIGAYNAALMRIERHQAGDREAAQQLLRKASDQGDVKAKTLLEKIAAGSL